MSFRHWGRLRTSYPRLLDQASQRCLWIFRISPFLHSSANCRLGMVSFDLEDQEIYFVSCFFLSKWAFRALLSKQLQRLNIPFFWLVYLMCKLLVISEGLESINNLILWCLFYLENKNIDFLNVAFCPWRTEHNSLCFANRVQQNCIYFFQNINTIFKKINNIKNAIIKANKTMPYVKAKPKIT